MKRIRSVAASAIVLLGAVAVGCASSAADRGPVGSEVTDDSAVSTSEPAVPDGDAALPMTFDTEMVLAPRLSEDATLFPFGWPETLRVSLGMPEWVDAQNVDDAYYGGATGGTAQLRRVTLASDAGEVETELIFPGAIPAATLERNAGSKNIALDSVALDAVQLIPAGTPARSSCSLNGEIIAGWIYDGSPGDLRVTVLIDVAQDARLAGVGLLVQWTGGWERRLLAGVSDAEIGDGCGAQAGLTEWGWGTALGGGGG